MGRREAGEQALQKAMRNLDRHMKMNPDDSWALVVGAVNLAELGDREQAIAWAERAIDASDDEPVICYNSACTFAVLGESNRALEVRERAGALRSEEHTSEIQSLMRNADAGFCLKKKKKCWHNINGRTTKITR